jgi:hypothetical protein
MIRSILNILMVSLVSVFALSACTKSQESTTTTSDTTTTTTNDAAPMPSATPDAAH